MKTKKKSRKLTQLKLASVLVAVQPNFDNPYREHYTTRCPICRTALMSCEDGLYCGRCGWDNFPEQGEPRVENSRVVKCFTTFDSLFFDLSNNGVIMTHESFTLKLGSLTTSSGRRQYRARFVKAGRVKAAGNRQSNIEVTEKALVSAFNNLFFDSKAVFLDHAGWFDHPSLKNLAGVTSDIEYDPASKAIVGTITLYSGMEHIATLLDDMLAEGKGAPDVGLSIVFWPVWEESSDENSVAPEDRGYPPRRER